MEETIIVKVLVDHLIDVVNKLPEDRDFCQKYILITSDDGMVKIKWEDALDEYNKLPRDRNKCPLFIEIQAKPLFDIKRVR